MQSTNVDVNNTGITFVGAGYQPPNAVSRAAATYALLQSDLIDQPTEGRKLADKWKRIIWAISDTANQSLIVDEETEEG